MTTKKYISKTKINLFLSKVKNIQYYPEGKSAGNTVTEQETVNKNGKVLKSGEQFELLVEKKLKESGFQKATLEYVWLTKEDVKNRKQNIDLIKSFYVHHPMGASKHPDFVVIDNGKIFYVECKTNKSAYKPMWGSAFPEGSDIWIFCCGYSFVNGTTFFLGEDAVVGDDGRFLKDLQAFLLDQDRELNKLLREKFGWIGIDLRPKKYFDHSLKEESPFYHPDREDRETRVLDLTNKP